MSDPLPLAYSDPYTYLAQIKFHQSLLFRPTWLAPDDSPHRVSYALSGDLNGPLLVIINGLGGNRLQGAILDGLASEHGVHILTLDRPSCGASTPVPLSHRVRWAHESLLAIHAANSLPNTFAILSHSNGVIYTLYTLLHLPPHLSVSHWDLSSPWVPPWNSGSLTLGLAARIPPAATRNLGPLITSLFTIAEPFVALGSVSSGMASWSSGVVRGKTKATDVNEAPAKERAKFLESNALLAEDKQTFGGAYFSNKTLQTGFDFVFAEGLDQMGLEACICLRKGDGDQWGWGMEGEEKDTKGLYERGFRQLKEKNAEGTPVRMRVFVGSSDFLVPPKGQKHLKRVLVEQLELVDEKEWVEFKGAGHDEIMGRTAMMGRAIADVAARESQSQQQ
ncbi:hypothetical protein RQP46_002860 [Phenoliferia psychrophenolica]